MENYKQKYEQAFERAKGMYEQGMMPERIEYIFPELKESEDERIRKELIHFLETCQDTRLVGNRKRDKWIEWLEKQGEQKSQGKSAFEAAKEEKIDDANKVESKFKAGDWIISNDSSRLFRRIVAVDKSGYGYTTDCGYYNHNYYDNNFHLWTITDAKDGDVLAADGCYVIFKKIDDLNIKCYCTYHYMNNPTLFVNTLQNKTTFYPATKEQRDFLFQKMKEAGYEWDSNKKELIRYE